MVHLVEDFIVTLDECPCCGKELCPVCKRHNESCVCPQGEDGTVIRELN